MNHNVKITYDSDSKIWTVEYLDWKLENPSLKMNLDMIKDMLIHAEITNVIKECQK